MHLYRPAPSWAWLSLVTLAAGLSGACGSTSEDPGSFGAGGWGGAGFDPQASGLPCDVAQVIGDECVSCHSSPPGKGVPMSLTSLDALLQPAPSDPSKTVAEMCVARMNDAQSPMPPSGQLAASQVQKFSDWVAAGMPAGSCASGTGGTGGVSYTPTCTSNQHWLYGNQESPMMHPGGACIACHTTSFEAPPLTIAGTVFGSSHDSDDCFGAQGAVVEITDNAGQIHTLTTNTAGNFYYQGPVSFPIKAKVKANGLERAMKQSVDTGDCNSCHTEAGLNGAPGRITSP